MYERFEKIMIAKGLTPYKVAKGSGVSQATISEWKNGKLEPRYATLQKIADFLSVPVSAFFESEQEQYYIDPQTAEIAQEMYDRPELKVLMDASRKLSADDIKAVQAMVDHLWKVQHPED